MSWRMGGVIAMVLGLALTGQAQPIRSICVMPVEEAPALRQAIEQWLQFSGFQTVDCLQHAGAGDVVLGFFWNREPVMSDEYFVYAQNLARGNRVVGSVAVIQNVFPPTGVTLWLQYHDLDATMLYYGQSPNLLSGLKAALKCAKKGKGCGFR